MIGYALLCLGMAQLAIGIIYGFMNRSQTSHLWLASYGTNWYISCSLDHDRLGQLVGGGYAALQLYYWWTGGGNGKWRRLKKKIRKFTPVRRTAPQLT